jgi:hypothetical protein
MKHKIKMHIGIQQLEEYVLGRLIADGLVEKDGCSISSDYINNRWN